MLAIGILLVFSLVMAKALGAASYGVFAYIWSWLIVLATIATFGTDVLVVREIAKTDHTTGVVKWSIRRILSASVCVVLAAYFLRDLFAVSRDAAGMLGFYAMLVCIPLLAFVRLLQGILQAHGLSAQSQLPQLILMPLLTLGFAGVLFLSGDLNVGTAMAGMMLALAGSLAWAVWYYLRKVHRSRPVLDVTSGVDHKDWMVGALALSSVAVASMANEQIGVLLLGGFGYAESAGAFDIVRKMAIVVSLGLMMVNVPLAPTIARKLAVNEVDNLQKEIKSAVRFAFAVSLVIALFMLLLGKPVLGLLDPRYEAVYPALMILVAGQLVNVASGPVWLVLNMAGLVRYAAAGLVAGAAVNILISSLLLHDHGAFGVAIGSVAGLVTWNMVQLYFVRKNLAINASIV